MNPMYFTKYKHKLAIIVIFGILLNVLSDTVVSGSSPIMQLSFEGDVSGTFSESAIKNELPTVSGYGGSINSYGNIKVYSATKWQGIHLPLMMNSILGNKGYNVTIIAVDGYNKTLTQSQVEGDIRAFDDTNTTLDVSVIPVLAYEGNETSVGDEDGPLRIIFVGENNQSIYTDGFRWIKQVVTIHVATEDGSTFTVSSSDSFTTTTATTRFDIFGILFGVSIILGYYLRRRKL